MSSPRRRRSSRTLSSAPRARRPSDALPNGRTPQLVAELAPGLTDNTPNTEQVTISAGFAFDNSFLIDGVDAEPQHLRISPKNL